MELPPKILELFQAHDFFQNLLASVFLFLFVSFARFLSLRAIQKLNLPSGDMKRRWLVNIKNMALILFLIGLVFIWAAQLRTFAFSLAALLAAFVIAFKELLMCVMGGVIRSSQHLFRLGDRIEITGLKGIVIDHNFWVTTLLEVGSQRDNTQAHWDQVSGRVLHIPNSLFIAQPLVNETFTNDFNFLFIRIPISREDDWKLAELCLLEAAREETDHFLADAKALMDNLSRTQGIEKLRVDPHVTLHFHDIKTLDLCVRVPCRPGERISLEQKILRKYLFLREENDRANALAKETNKTTDI